MAKNIVRSDPNLPENRKNRAEPYTTATLSLERSGRDLSGYLPSRTIPSNFHSNALTPAVSFLSTMHLGPVAHVALCRIMT